MGQRNERGDTTVDCGRIGNIKEFQDYEHTMFFSLPRYWGVWLTVALSQ